MTIRMNYPMMSEYTKPHRFFQRKLTRVGGYRGTRQTPMKSQGILIEGVGLMKELYGWLEDESTVPPGTAGCRGVRDLTVSRGCH